MRATGISLSSHREQCVDGKLHDRNAKESWALLEDLTLYDNKSWNDPRDFAKLVKAISLPQDVLYTFDRRLIELENEVQCLMEAHLAPKQHVQMNKITSSCEICSGPHDTQYCMENIDQSFVEYASLRTDESGRQVYAQEVLGFSNNFTGGNPTPTSEPIISDSSLTLTPFEGCDFILEEIETYLKDDSISPEIDHGDLDLEGDLRLIEELLNNDSSSPLPLSHNSSTTFSSPSLTPVETSDALLEKFIDELALLKPFPSGISDDDFDLEGDILLLGNLLNVDPSSPLPPKELNFEKLKMIKSLIDDFSSINDAPKDNVKIYSNPLFEYDDEYISSDVNPLFDEVLEDIESKDSYVSNLDEPALLVTPLSDANEDECFDPRGVIDEIDAFLDMDISTDIENGYHDSKGDIIYLESLLIDDTIPNLPPEGCKRLQIYHICFADDMLVFCHGDVESVNVVKKALDPFSQVFGLKPNMGMCISFFGNLGEHMKEGILRVMPFRVGKLLVSYLGVPLGDLTKGRAKIACKNKLRPHVVMKTRDGRNTFFWHDKWYTQSPISEHVSMELVIQASQSGNEKINDLIENEEWMWCGYFKYHMKKAKMGQKRTRDEKSMKS
ncbi:hypothetical protein Tco_0458281 [Tanacetum coccineum]